MRAAFISELSRLAETDSRIVLLTADLGFGVVERFADRHPERFFNVGVAEQNAVGLATGLANSGFVPFVYSITNFAILRPFEFLRNGPVLHRLPVRVVGTGAGVEYGTNGVTHFGLEDVAACRILPGLGIVAPADGQQAVSALRQTYGLAGPLYYRLGKREVTVPSLTGRFDASGLTHLAGATSGDVLVLALGSAATQAFEGWEGLEKDSRIQKQGVSSGVAVVSYLHDGSEALIADFVSSYRTIVTVESHGRTGGLGSLVSEAVAARGLGIRVERVAVEDWPEVCGSQAYLEELLGISAKAVREAICRTREPV